MSIQVVGIMGNPLPKIIENLKRQNFEICDTNAMVARAYLEIDDSFAYQLWPAEELRKEMELTGGSELEAKWIPEYPFDLKRRILSKAENNRFEVIREFQNLFINPETLWLRRELLNTIAENKTIFTLQKEVEYEYKNDPYIDDYREWLYKRGWHDGDVQKWVNETGKWGKTDPFEREVGDVDEYFDLQIESSITKISQERYSEINNERKIAVLNVHSESEKEFIRQLNGVIYQPEDLDELPSGLIPESNGQEITELINNIENCGSLEEIKAIEVGWNPNTELMVQIAEKEHLEILSYQDAVRESVTILAGKIRDSLTTEDRVWFESYVYPNLKKIPSAIDPAGFISKILENRNPQEKNRKLLLCDFEKNGLDSIQCAVALLPNVEIHFTR